MGKQKRQVEIHSGERNPTILPALISAGYDRDFDELMQHADVAMYENKKLAKKANA